MPHAFMDSVVRILHIIDDRRYFLLREVAATSIGLLLGAFLFGKKGAFAGALMGALLVYEPIPDYKKVLARVKALSDDDKEVLSNMLQEQSGCKTLEDFAKFSEDDDNARDIFALIEDFLNFKDRQKQQL